MKQTLTLILTALFLCAAITPSVLAEEASTVSSDTIVNTDSSGDTDAEDSLDTATPSNAGMVTDVLENTVSISEQETAPMLTESPAAITLTCFDEPYRTDAVAFPVGAAQEDLYKWFDDSVMGFTGYDAEGNPYDFISGAWSLDAVDTETAGVYYAFTSPDLGTEYTLADGVSQPLQLCAVSIQVPGEPDINCCVAGRGFLRFPWVLSAAQEEQLGEFNVWLRQDGGEWASLSDGFLFVSDSLQLSQRIFTYGSSYELKVTYPGGQTGILTFQYDGELSILDYSGGDRDGGDVNGEDSGTGSQPAPTPSQTPDQTHETDTPQDSGTTPSEQQTPQDGQDSSSDEAQPAQTAPQSTSDSQNSNNYNSDSNLQVQPQTPATPTEPAVPVFSEVVSSQEAESTSSSQENDVVLKPKDSTQAATSQALYESNTPTEKNPAAPETAAVTESYSPTQTIISGLRLKDLCKEEESVVFGSGDLTVSIPSKLLLALNLSDSDTLAVTLTQPESNQIVLAVEVSGKSVTERMGAVLRLQYMPQSENTVITVQSEDGEPITDISYDGKLLRFTADKTGTYTIMEQLHTQEAQKNFLPLLPVSGGLIIAGAGITVFRRRLHG